MEINMIDLKEVVLPECNFPTPWQAVIFRNIGMIPDERIAKVLGTDAETVRLEAQRMGIGDIVYDPEWEKSGYITIIRSNWFILSLSQMLTLLNYTEEQLFFILRDEDFLWVKLGYYKPVMPDVYYAPLTEGELAETERVKEILTSIDCKGGRKSFDFFSSSLDAKAPPADKSNTRFIHGYLTPCGDAFLVDSEEYLSDELLMQYQSQGVNGIWLHGLLATLSPYPYIPERSEGYEKRRKNLSRLIERAGKYGIGIYLYFNEPRCLPHDIAPKFPKVLGHNHPRGMALCLNVPEVEEYLYNAVYDLLCECKLAGIMTITMSENPTHCRSKDLETNCPRCKNTPFEDLAARVNNIFKRAIDDAGTGTELIANLWSWSVARGWTDEQIQSGIRQLDSGISVLLNSEFDLPINKGGIDNRVVDYSISNPGPSPVSKDALTYAASLGHKVYAKIQANNSWECSAVPYLPVFDLVKEHIDNLTEIGVDNYMLSWTLGGYPSPTLNYIANHKNMTLDEWYSYYFGENAEPLHEAVKVISDAFREYPFSCDHLYFSPQTIGPYNMWTDYPDEKRSTMVCFAYDDYEFWCEKYPYDIFVSQTEKMLKGWKRGLEMMSALKGRSNEIDSLILYTEVAYIHLNADLIQTKYAYMKRDIKRNKNEIIALVRESAEDARRLSYLASLDPTIGYEASNHYFYSAHLLREKVLNCDKLIRKLEG